MARQIPLLSLTSSSKRSKRIRICESFNLRWRHLVSCQTTMRSFDWRGSPDDTGMVPANESARACARVRSEEHTSELQSLAYLVCRLLLEKKKKNSKQFRAGDNSKSRRKPASTNS